MVTWETLIQQVRHTTRLRFADVELDMLNAMKQMNSEWITGAIEEGIYRQKATALGI